MDINQFCAANNDLRTYLHKPIKLNKCVTATNGHMIIYVPDLEIESYTANTPASTIARLSDLLEECQEVTNWQPAGDVTLPEKLQCKACEGSGKLNRIACPECDGARQVCFENSFNEYECDCETCNANGVIKVEKEPFPVCDWCNGEKHVWDERIRFIVNNVRVNPAYYQMIAELPDLQLAEQDEKRLYFKSGIYIGAIMGITK